MINLTDKFTNEIITDNFWDKINMHLSNDVIYKVDEGTKDSVVLMFWDIMDALSDFAEIDLIGYLGD